ncbi:DUF6266 family protein [Pedobacter foliorum]|uniref:DUF6266 family protein n=1 Tax=Pedobacter foliorum TaxID=2739058 RepID=UPI00156720D9|nr:DUF6266 family protein [Pedobacter foliorum]NRF39330.1 hypothetical protein [Pedobacter foliorum]
MGIIQNGPHGTFTGRIGNMVYYVLNGKNVCREIGVNTNPPTVKQLKNRLEVKLVGEFFRDLKAFIDVGFSTEPIKAGDSPYNFAVEYNRNKIIKGSYPDLEIAYDKVLVSRGFLKPVKNLVTEQTAGAIKFSWDTNPQMAWPEATDQVMMLAYFVESKKIIYQPFGNSRLSGSDELQIPESLAGEQMETYVSFVAADRKGVADSTYAGSFIA